MIKTPHVGVVKLSLLCIFCRVASNILLDMMLQQRHERAMEELEKEMKIELQRSRDQMNAELNEQMMAALSVSTYNNQM